jgi:hypothetical protein
MSDSLVSVSVNEELEHEIFIRNNGDILDISTEIVEVGINTSFILYSAN